MTSCISNALCLSMCTSVPVFSTESSSLSSSGSRTAKLTDNHIPLGTDQEEDLHTLARNTSLESNSLRGDLGRLQTQVSSLCGEDGQLGQLRTDLGVINASTTLLQDTVNALRFLKGSYCKKWQDVQVDRSYILHKIWLHMDIGIHTYFVIMLCKVQITTQECIWCNNAG